MSEVENEGNEPRVQLGPHPLGGIKIAIRDLEGGFHETRIDLPEAAMVYAHLGALITMGFQSIYAQALQAQSQNLVVPGGK